MKINLYPSRILFAFFRLGNLTITLFGPLLGNQWQSSMLEEYISISNFLNNLRAVSSCSEFSINSARLFSSKYFRLTVTPALSFQWNNVLPQFWVDLSEEAKFWLHFLITLPEVSYFFIYACQGGIKFVLRFQNQSN